MKKYRIRETGPSTDRRFVIQSFRSDSLLAGKDDWHDEIGFPSHRTLKESRRYIEDLIEAHEKAEAWRKERESKMVPDIIHELP